MPRLIYGTGTHSPHPISQIVIGSEPSISLSPIHLSRTKRGPFVYALFNNDRIRDATIKLQEVRQWGIPFRPLGIFQDREVANRQVVARFDDVCKVYFPSLELNRQGIVDYLGENIQRVLRQ